MTQSKNQKRMSYKPTVAIDFDDTIAVNDRWPDIGPPKEGVRDALKALSSKYEIIIYTCRTNLKSEYRTESIAAIQEYMKYYDLPYDRLDLGLEGKVFADFYIDDKAIAFEDNWEEISEALMDSLS